MLPPTATQSMSGRGRKYSVLSSELTARSVDLLNSPDATEIWMDSVFRS